MDGLLVTVLTVAVLVEFTQTGRTAYRSLALLKHAGGTPTRVRQRVALSGGELEAGPLLEGGFAVRATLPLPQKEG